MVKLSTTPIMLASVGSIFYVSASPAGRVERQGSAPEVGKADTHGMPETPAVTSTIVVLKNDPVTDLSAEPSKLVNSNPGGALPPPSSDQSKTTPIVSKQGVTFDGCSYNVDGVGQFSNFASFTFEDGIPDGLYASDYVVRDTDDNDQATWNHVFKPENVYTDGDFLNLVVPAVTGEQSDYADNAIACAEIVTSESQILYGSFRVNAIFSTVPGTCHGFFFYQSDNQETDIEYLTDPNSEANNMNSPGSADGGPIPIWYSNQAVTAGTSGTASTGPPPWDVTAVHEYRIDWTADATMYYLDGVLQKRYTTNVPSTPGSFIWNNWANGDPTWSVGPPSEDNVFKLLNITMYYNTAGDNAC